ncbi:MAG: glycosyltransferase [Deltaproteobacteria bacterium]|jgi:glycosyltransferase involved in cell wall biosynthesis|nr:glycosyltransferase [Deltaproteobacteria bacterium]
MTEENMIEENKDGIKSAQIVVAIPSYNEAKLIGFPTKMASEGLVRYFGDKTSVIINCDNNSPDGTKEAFLGTSTEVSKIYLSTPPGVKGKGNNFKNLFRKACELGAEAIVCVDADLKSITPRWIKNLGEPIFEDFGFVAPLYVRHKYDGTITNNIAYPMLRSIYGRRVRQPIGGDFAFSGKLAELYLKQDSWQDAVSQFGIDIWMTVTAITNNIPICQSFMGRPKIHKPKDPSSSLGPMFIQVVGTIFDLMARNPDSWKDIKWSKPTAIIGFGLGETEQPPPVDVNVERLYENFIKGFNKHKDILKRILQENIYAKLNEIKALSFDNFEFPSNLWAMILMDFVIAYKNESVERTETLEALIPLYFGRTCSFVVESNSMTTQQAEEMIEDQCIIFEKNKPYLLKKWFE